jgi:hypothetical protein
VCVHARTRAHTRVSARAHTHTMRTRARVHACASARLMGHTRSPEAGSLRAGFSSNTRQGRKSPAHLAVLAVIPLTTANTPTAFFESAVRVGGATMWSPTRGARMRARPHIERARRCVWERGRSIGARLGTDRCTSARRRSSTGPRARSASRRSCYSGSARPLRPRQPRTCVVRARLKGICPNEKAESGQGVLSAFRAKLRDVTAGHGLCNGNTSASQR